MIKVIAALALMTVPAFAHYKYDALCCSDRDCAPISDKAVTETDDGFTVELGPDDHPMLKEAGVTEKRQWFIPRKDAKRALDFDYHACFSPSGTLLCFYQRGKGA